MVCFTFMVLISALFLLIRSLIVQRTALAAENLALRQQLAVLNRKIHWPQIHFLAARASSVRLSGIGTKRPRFEYLDELKH